MIDPDYALEKALGDVHHERQRQENFQRAGRFPFTAANLGLTNVERAVILGKTVGGVFLQSQQQPDGGLAFVDVQDKFDQQRSERGEARVGGKRPDGIPYRDPDAGTRSGLRAALIATAAVAVAWVEALDSLDGSARPVQSSESPAEAGPSEG